MATINNHFLELSENYLFATIAKKVRAYRETYPERRVISLGIGDVTRPLAPAVIEAMHRAADEMGNTRSFRGYGPEHGYDFLREAIIEGDYKSRGVVIDKSEIFINDGAKSDTANICDIFGNDNIIAITNPVYPVYVDSNVMAGRNRNIHLLKADASTGFLPDLPEGHVDLIYLCYPNNPTGTVMSREELSKWVGYALATGAVILYDSAYEAYIRDEAVPHSIYEIPNARRCCIEFRSFSKTAGFTGVRCGYTVVPRDLKLIASDGREVELNHLWERRQCTKFNGASYISQRAAEAIYTPVGRSQIREVIDYYLKNAEIIGIALKKMGLEYKGGVNAPYLWVKTPDSMSSWEFFDELLEKASLVCTPGVGFGSCGEGYVRFTAFGDRADAITAMERLNSYLQSRKG